MASTSKDTGEPGKAEPTGEVRQVELFSLVPIDEATYHCRQLTIGNFQKKESHWAKVVKMFRKRPVSQKKASGGSSRKRSLHRQRSFFGKSFSRKSRVKSPSRSPPKSPTESSLISPLKPVDESQIGSPSKSLRMTEETDKEKTCNKKLTSWDGGRSFNIDDQHSREQPNSSRDVADDKIEEEEEEEVGVVEVNRDHWRHITEPLSLNPRFFNPNDSCTSAQSQETLDDSNLSPTSQPESTPARHPSIARSVAATAESSTNLQRRGIMSLAYHEQYVYAIGVLKRGVATKRVYRYPLKPVEGDGSHQRWEQICSLPQRRPYHASTTIGKRIYVLGGGNWDRNTETLTTAICLKPKNLPEKVWSDSFRAACRGYLIPRRKHCVAVLNGTVVMLGGENSIGQKMSSIELPLNENLEYLGEGCERMYSKRKAMNHARSSFLTVTHSNLIYVIGGCDQEMSTGRITIECYNYRVDQWHVLDGFNGGMLCFFGFVYDSKICILGGDPRTCDLSEETTNSLKAKGMDPPPIVWKSPPAINLPEIDLNDSIATVTGIMVLRSDVR